jgi:hypothetical protein
MLIKRYKITDSWRHACFTNNISYGTDSFVIYNCRYLKGKNSYWLMGPILLIFEKIMQLE